MVTSMFHSRVGKTSDGLWEMRIPSRLAECTQLVNEFISRVEAWGVTSTDTLALRHGMHEAVVNAIRHGNAGDESRQVRVAWQFTGNEVHIEVEDEGAGFDVPSIDDPTIPINLERVGGRGVLMMRHFMNSVEFNESGNCVNLRRVCERSDASV